MTKADFLRWLERYRYVDNISKIVKERIWTEDELDRLKTRLENGGQLELKNENRKKMAWG